MRTTWRLLGFGLFVGLFGGFLAEAAPLALVYNGPGACQEGCAQAAAAIALHRGFDVKFVTAADIQPALLKKALVWIQPGGDAILVAKAITDDKKDLLRTFIRRGGGYLGFCAGAFFSDYTVDDANTIAGLGIIPGTTHDYKTPEKSTVLAIDWRGTKRYLYFEEGGWFDFPADASVLTLGRYATGEVAAIAAHYGNGVVAVSGPHPEAPPEWLEEHNLVDPDGPDLDLADQMLGLAVRAIPASRLTGRK